VRSWLIVMIASLSALRVGDGLVVMTAIYPRGVEQRATQEVSRTDHAA
jgi:hypothetical protein